MFGSGGVGVMLVLLAATACQANHQNAATNDHSTTSAAATPVSGCAQVGSVPAPKANVRGLSEVSAPADNDVWALGYFNTGQESGPSGQFAAHWDGHAWHVTRLRVPEGGVVTGIAAVDPNDVWVVGAGANHPLIEHWNGNTWGTVPSAGDGVLNSITALSASDAWAVGTSGGKKGRTLIDHWNGSQWSVVPSPSPRPNPITSHPGAILDAVSAISPTDIWAVGERGNYIPVGPSNTLAEHWDGTRWRVVPSPTVTDQGGKPYDHLLDVTATPAGVWAVGSHSSTVGVGGGQELALLLHWNGSRWLVEEPPHSTQADILWSATAASDSLWVGGQRAITNMLVAKRRGSRWAPAPLPSTKGYLAAITATQTVAASGSSARRSNDDRWRFAATPPPAIHRRATPTRRSRSPLRRSCRRHRRWWYDGSQSATAPMTSRPERATSGWPSRRE